jgi:hypothetical protein
MEEFRLIFCKKCSIPGMGRDFLFITVYVLALGPPILSSGYQALFLMGMEAKR